MLEQSPYMMYHFNKRQNALHLAPLCSASLCSLSAIDTAAYTITMIRREKCIDDHKIRCIDAMPDIDDEWIGGGIGGGRSSGGRRSLRSGQRDKGMGKAELLENYQRYKYMSACTGLRSEDIHRIASNNMCIFADVSE